MATGSRLRAGWISNVDFEVDTSFGGNSNSRVEVTADVSDYPTVNIQWFGTPDTTALRLGSRVGSCDMTFIVTSISTTESKVRRTVNNRFFGSTYSIQGVHVSKVCVEARHSVKDFVVKNKGAKIKETKSSYFFDFRDIAKYANKNSPVVAQVYILKPDFFIEFPKIPEATELFSIADYLEDYCDRFQLVRVFNRTGIGFGQIGARGNLGQVGGIFSDVTFSGTVADQYQDSLVIWEEKPETKKNKIKIKKIKNEYCIYEGDYLPHIPPDTEGQAPRDLSVMVDNSGMTKQFKLTKYVYGEPEVELSGIFGYAHAAIELAGDPTLANNNAEVVLNMFNEGVIESSNAYEEILGSLQSGTFGFPDDSNLNTNLIWRLIELKETKYEYRNVSPNIEPHLLNKDNSIKKIEINPEYQKVINCNFEVLVAKETNGWEIRRFAQESADAWAEGSINAWIQLDGLVQNRDTILANGDRASLQLYNYLLYSSKVQLEQYLYRKIPIYERTEYKIAPYSEYYKDTDNINWDLELVPKKDTSEKSDSDDEEEFIAVLTPDISWSPSLMVLAESRYKSSIGISGNPNYDPFARNYYGSNPVTLISGSEEYEFTKYTVLPSINTEDKVAANYARELSLSAVVSAVNSSASLPGTIYPKEYMATKDNLGNITASNFSFGSSGKAGQEDRYIEEKTYRNAQDNSFSSKITTGNFTIAEGRPPSAALRKPLFELEEDEDDDNKPLKGEELYITERKPLPSISRSGGIQLPPGLSNNGIKDRIEKIVARRRFLSGVTVSAQCAWGANPRNLINFGVSIPCERRQDGGLVIKRATSVMEMHEGKTFPQFTVVEAGLFDDKVDLRIKSKKVKKKPDTPEDGVNLQVEVDLPTRYGNTDPIPSDFSRWVDI